MSLIKPLRKLIKSNNIGNVIRCSSALAAASPSQPTLTLTSKLELKSKLLVDFEVHFTGNHIKLNAFNKSAKFSHSKTLPYIWLRANCSCPRCYNQVAAECEVNMASLDPVNANRPLEVVDEGKRVKLVWRDGHKSEFELTELASLALAHVQSTAASRSRVLWNNEILKSQGGLTRLPYDGYLKDEGVLTQALAAVHKFGAVIIEGVPKNENEIEKVCSRIGPIQTSHFGPKHCLVTADLTFADRAYTQLALGAHTDTAYLKNSAGLELFHVIRKPDDGGGKSLLVDGFYCANQLKQLEPNDFEFLSQTKIEMISYKENSCHFRHFAPVIKADSFTGELEQIRFNPYNKTSLVHLSSDEIEFYYSSMKKYVNLLEHESNEHWISLNPDEILIFDNFRLLHGRSAFRGQRTLVTAYLSRDDWLSKARLLNVF